MTVTRALGVFLTAAVATAVIGAAAAPDVRLKSVRARVHGKGA